MSVQKQMISDLSATLASKSISADGRGNVSTTVTDIAGRAISVTDAAGVRTLSYNAYGGQLHVRHGLV